MRRGDWIETYSGVQFYPLDPRPEDVRLADIAHSLAMTCRFNGHAKFHYSVAQHSLFVADLLPEPLRIYGLLHDAHEAYTGDMTRPVKRSLAVGAYDAYSEMVARCERVVLDAFGLPLLSSEDGDLVVEADNRMLATERRDVMRSKLEWLNLDAEPLGDPIVPMRSEEAAHAFIWRIVWAITGRAGLVGPTCDVVQTIDEKIARGCPIDARNGWPR